MNELTKEQTEAKLKEIIQAKLDIPLESLHSAANLNEDLGVDSIDVLDVGYEIEESFGIQLTDFEEMLHIKTLDDFSNFIYLKCNSEGIHHQAQQGADNVEVIRDLPGESSIVDETNVSK